MAKSKKNITPKRSSPGSQKRKPTLYNKILKIFTEANKNVEPEKKLSISQRRDYIKKMIMPNFAGESPYRVSKQRIDSVISNVYQTVVPKEGCDVNLISPSVVANIAWFELDEFIVNIIPNCVYIRIDAGKFGQTKIFNTLNYDYNQNGVRQIVENLREYAENDTEVDLSLTGVKSLRPKKKNDGNPENYYIDFVLVINSEPIKDIDPVIVNIPESDKKEIKKKKTKVRNAILARVNELKKAKRRKANARKNAKKNIKDLEKIQSRYVRTKNQEKKQIYELTKYSIYAKALRMLNLSIKRGNITKAQYEQYFNKIGNLAFSKKLPKKKQVKKATPKKNITKKKTPKRRKK